MLMQTFPSQFWVGGKRLGRKRRGGETSVIPFAYKRKNADCSTLQDADCLMSQDQSEK